MQLRTIALKQCRPRVPFREETGTLGWHLALACLATALAGFECYSVFFASSTRRTGRAPTAENESRSLSACLQALACGSNDVMRSPSLVRNSSHALASCDSWNLTLLPASSGDLVELPLAAWAQLHAQATWVLHFNQRCRGSVFPLYTTNAQFADSAVLGPPAMQATHGFRVLPFLAYTDLVVTQIPADLLCSAAIVANKAPPDFVADPRKSFRLERVRPLTLRSAFCSEANDRRRTSKSDNSSTALLAALWRARPGSPDVPVRLAPHVLGELARVSRNPAAPGSALLRLLFQGSAVPAAPSLPASFPAACAPRPLGSQPVRMAFPASRRGCSLGDLAAFSKLQLALALDSSPVVARLHNASDVVETLWAPMPGSNFAHSRLAAMAEAASASDARALSDAFYPQHRGRSLPSLVTFFNVGLLDNGVIVSVDELLRTGAASRGALRACELSSLQAYEPRTLSLCANRSEAGYLLAAAAKAPFPFPDTSTECAIPGLNDAVAADVVAQSLRRGSVVMTMVHTGELAADPRLSRGSTDGNDAAPCDPGEGWSCGVGHALDRREPKARLASFRVSSSFHKGLLQLLRTELLPPTGLDLPVLCPPRLPRSTPAESPAANLPVFDDVLHLDGSFEDNYYWWLAGGAGALSLVRTWLVTFPHAVIHCDATAAVAWRDLHVKTLALLGIDPRRVVFGPALARRVHVLDEADRWRAHPAQLLAWRDAALDALDEAGCLVKGTAATQSRRRYRSEGGLPPPCTAAIAAISAATSRSRGVQVGAKDGPIVLLVTRLDASNRRWESAPAVATALEAAGARVLYYSLDGTISGGVAPLLDGLALFAAADVVIAAHGAALVNSLVLRPGATLLEIVPKGHAGYGLMYLWQSRLVAGLVGVNPAPIEYHNFVAPGTRTTRVLEPHLPALLPWALCAVRRAAQAPGMPACAASDLL